MTRLLCPQLAGEVELSFEREEHIAARHPDLLPEHRDLLARTISDPDQIRRSGRFEGARLLSRWYPELKGGKHLVVVVVSEPTAGRHWVVTAYIARRLAEGEREWVRS